MPSSRLAARRTPTTTAMAPRATTYDVPIQMMGFDPNFHFVGMTFNPEAFADMKDKYFLLNGRSYPTPSNQRRQLRDDRYRRRNAGAERTDGDRRFGWRLASLAAAAQPRDAGQDQRQDPRAAAHLRPERDRIHTLATVGIPMQVIAENARLLRDTDGNNLYYKTNSVTLGGGESTDVILDASRRSERAPTTSTAPISIICRMTPKTSAA